MALYTHTHTHTCTHTRTHTHINIAAQQSVTKFIAMILLNLVTPKATDKHKLLFYRPNYDSLGKRNCKICCGLYHKNIMTVNTPPESSEVRLQVVASLTIVILMALELSFTLLENSYSTGITHDGHHL